MEDRIEKYLSGQLNDDGRRLIEQEILQDSTFRERVELEQTIVAQIRSRAFVDKQIQVARSEIKNKRIIKATIITAFSMAASFLVIFYVAIFWQQQNSNQLFASNFEVYPMHIQNESLRNGDLNIAMKAYDAMDFITAEKYFNLIVNDAPENRFYLSITQIQNGKLHEALNNLETLHNQTIEFRYTQHTLWYLALVHIKLGQHGRAKILLTELATTKGEFALKAKKLLTEL